MTITAATKREVLEAQGHRCGKMQPDGTRSGCGLHLWIDPGSLKITPPPNSQIKLPKGRSLVEYDHITPQAERGTDAADNVQALCWACHHDKTEDERPEWKAPTQSPLLSVVQGKRREPQLGPGPGKGAQNKPARLRARAPNMLGKLGSLGRGM